MREELLKGLTEEQIRKLRECKDTEEILKLAKEEGIELTDEQLEAVSGGFCVRKAVICPVCNSENTKFVKEESAYDVYECKNCGYTFHY